MPRKPRSKQPGKPISAKQRAADDELRAAMRTGESGLMDKFAELLKKAVAAPGRHGS